MPSIHFYFYSKEYIVELFFLSPCLEQSIDFFFLRQSIVNSFFSFSLLETEYSQHFFLFFLATEYIFQLASSFFLPLFFSFMTIVGIFFFSFFFFLSETEYSQQFSLFLFFLRQRSAVFYLIFPRHRVQLAVLVFLFFSETEYIYNSFFLSLFFSPETEYRQQFVCLFFFSFLRQTIYCLFFSFFVFCFSFLLRQTIVSISFSFSFLIKYSYHHLQE